MEEVKSQQELGGISRFAGSWDEADLILAKQFVVEALNTRGAEVEKFVITDLSLDKHRSVELLTTK